MADTSQSPRSRDRARGTPAPKLRGAGRRTPDVRALILAAALDEFATAGFQAASLRSIAQSAGVSHPTVLHHFGSKQKLFLSVMREQEEEDTRLSSRISTADDLDGVVEGFVAVLQKYRDTSALSTLWTGVAVAAAGDSSHPVRAFVVRRYERWTSDIASVLRRGQTQGFVDPGIDVHASAIAVLAMLDGLQTHAIADPDVQLRPVVAAALRMFGRSIAEHEPGGTASTG